MCAPGLHPLRALSELRAPGSGRDAAVDDGGENGPDNGSADVDRDVIMAALIGWAVGCRTLNALRAAIDAARARLGRLRRDDAPLLLATTHSTKGLAFDHVAVIGLDEGCFPSARSVTEALEPERALKEERRLAYVAWTRARRSLTLVYDPGAPSQFLARGVRSPGAADRDVGERQERLRAGRRPPSFDQFELQPAAGGSADYGDPTGQSLPTPGLASKQWTRCWMVGLIGVCAVIQSARTWSSVACVVPRLMMFG